MLAWWLSGYLQLKEQTLENWRSHGENHNFQHFQQKNVFMICGKLSHIDMLYKYYIISVKPPKVCVGKSSVRMTLKLRHKPEKARTV